MISAALIMASFTSASTQYVALSICVPMTVTDSCLFLQLILYGASSFLFEVYPGATGVPDHDTIASFFGARENSAGGYDFIEERLPSGWKNRVEPYTLYDLGKNIHDQYMMYKRPIGHNTGRGNFTEDMRQFPDDGTVTDMICLLYNQVTDNFPGKPPSYRWYVWNMH